MAGQVSFGFAVFFGLGAYTTALLMHAGHSPYFGFIGGAAIAMLASFLIGLPTFRLRGPYFVIATIGVTEAVRVIMNNLDVTGGSSGYRITEDQPFSQNEHYYSAIAAVALAVLVSTIVANSKFGLALRAIKQDEDAAADLGRKRVYVQALGPRHRRWTNGHCWRHLRAARGVLLSRRCFCVPDRNLHSAHAGNRRNWDRLGTGAGRRDLWHG